MPALHSRIFLAFVSLVEPLIRELERRAAKQELPERTPKALARIADKLPGRDFKGKNARDFRGDCGLPRAADRKPAGRIERRRAGPLQLG